MFKNLQKNNLFIKFSNHEINLDILNDFIKIINYYGVKIDL